MSSRVTLRQIAEKVGCSRSAVSYALKNHPSISEEKRVEIMKVAEELGWRPNAELARQMALVRSTVIKTEQPQLAFVIKQSSAVFQKGAASFTQLRGAEEYAESRGYGCDVFNIADKPLSARRLRDILFARGIEGIVFFGTVDPEMPEEYLIIGKEFACAVAGIRSGKVPYHCITSDFMSAGRLFIEKIVEKGYRRPAVLIPRGLDEQLGYAFTGGISTGLLDLALEDRLPIQHLGRTESHIPEYEYDRVKQWILRNRPDSIISTDIEHSEQLIEELKEYGMNLPLFSYDFFPPQKVSGGIDFRQKHIGRAAVDVVVGQLHRGQKGLPEVQRNVQIEGFWVEGTIDSAKPS